jgi:FAD/FMN-containing dehydrogenase
VDFPADDPIEIIKHLMIGSEVDGRGKGGQGAVRWLRPRGAMPAALQRSSRVSTRPRPLNPPLAPLLPPSPRARQGTLGFVSRATYNTVPEWPNKASAFIVFPDVRAASRAASILRDETAVDAVELFDRCAGQGGGRGRGAFLGVAVAAAGG